MPPDDPRKYLWDALRAAELARQFASGRSYAEYEHDAMLRSAVERQLEIIGEALNQLSKADPRTASGIPDLRRVVAFRNILVHGYAIVDNALVWQLLSERLPELERVVRALLPDEPQK
jgi:uncharacterized protein with HEPN domain